MSRSQIFRIMEKFVELFAGGWYNGRANEG
jgi:hypothetical protein